MSDRITVINQSTGLEQYHLTLFRDGESGTWRLFLEGEITRRPIIAGREWPQRSHIGNVDFSLSGLKDLHAALSKVLADIESDPEEYNAEVRKTWVDSDAG